MDRSRLFVCLAFSLTILFGSTYAFDAVKDVSVEAYLGVWYQTHTNIYSDFFAGIQDSECVTGTYGLINATSVTVYNAYKRRDGVKDELRGYAFIPDVQDPGKLVVRLDGVDVDAPYWIFKLGPIIDGQYQYSVVSDGGGLGLFVLCRDAATFHDLYEPEVLEYLALTGFTGTRAPIKEYQGPDCDYPPFEE